MLSVQNTTLPGLLIVDPRATHGKCGVERGVFHPTQYAAFGMTTRFASDRLIRNFQGSLRGLYSLPEEQPMLLTLVRGEMTLAVADTRAGSRRFGAVELLDLSESGIRQVYLPGGLSYGTYVHSADADWQEKHTGFYEPETADGIFWADKDLNINWPSRFPLLAERDAGFPTLEKRLVKA